MNRSNNLTPFLLAAAIIGFGLHATAATLNVPVEHATIQAAINAAAPGDTINIAAGTYTGSVSINKPLTLRGANAGIHPVVGTHPTATVGARGAETVLAYGNGPGAISVSADNITLDGLKITSTGTRILDTYADADNFTMRNCIWQNTSGYASQGTIQFGGGSHLNFTLEFNLIENGQTAFLYTGGNFDGLLIQYNRINCAGDAVFWTAEPLNGGVIKGNEIDGTIGGTPGVGFNTFNIGQAGDIRVEDNWIHDVHYTAFQLGVIGGQITGNTFEDTYPYSADPALYGGYDLYLWGGAWGTALSSDVTISGNTFRYNNNASGSVRAIRLAGPANAGDPAIDASTIHIHENLFYDGGAYTGTVAIRHQGNQVTTADATHNYWGVGTPDPNVLFTGPVAYVPYYTDEALTTLYYPVNNTTQSTGYLTIQAAVTAANPGDTIEVAIGTYTEGPISLNKAVTLLGPNAGVAGNATARGAEARIQNSKITVTAAATLDGFEIYQTNDTADAVLVQAGATVTNSVVRRDGISTGTIARGITTAVGIAGYSITGNLFTGDDSGGFFSGHKTWNSGLWLNGGSGNVSGNAFENCRTALNADDFNAGITITGNNFRTSGSYLAFGGTTPTDGQFAIAGNEFFLDWIDPVTNWLPSAVFNNSNVAATFRLDVTGNTFGGVPTTALSNDQKLAIEGRNFHRGRSGRNGVVDFVANEQVVLPGTTIASAVAAAAAGDTVRIGPGTYGETVSLNKSISFVGAGIGQTIWRGNTIGSRALQITRNSAAPANVHVEIAGFSFETENNQTIRGTWSTSNAEALTLDVHNNRFSHVNTRNPGTDFAMYVSGANQTPRGVTGELRVHDNQFDVVTGGLLFENCRAVDVVDNVFNTTYEGLVFNYYGSSGLVGEQFVEGNVFTHVPVDWAMAMNHWHGSGSYTVLPSRIVENDITATGFTYSILYGVAATQTTVHEFEVFRNTIRSGSLLVWGDYANQAGIDAEANWWGAANGPSHSSNPGGTGSPISDPVFYSPWYADEALTILVTAANFQNTTVAAGETVTKTDLYIGATYTVEGSLTVTGDLTLAEGATLEVINGSLTINGSTLSGTFTFFNSMGSINFNDDVAITGSAEGLILISDVHVADTATITVAGNLVIDGSVIDCQTPGGSYTLQVDSGATFTMTRTVFVDGAVNVDSGDTAIYDNRFESSTITVDASVTGARVFHNITDNIAWLIDNGTGTVTSVDSWENLTDPALTQNNLDLALDPGTLTDPGNDRTQDTDGNVYVQPGDLVTSILNVSDLQTEIAAVEVMLGYNTSLLATPGLVANANWNAVLDSNFDDSSTIGLIDSAQGYTLTVDPSAGSNADQPIATVALTAGLVEGETLFFHRVKLATDVFGGETRLTTGGASPAFLTPFTSNSAMITIDGTDPLIADPTVYATIEQFGDDVNTVTTPAAVTIQGDVDITAAAFDALAGIDDVDAVVTLVGPATYTATQTGISAGPTIGGDDYTTYAYTYTVDATTLNGTYNVVFTVTDRSGNQTVESLGSILINKNQVVVNVELEGLAAGPLTRDVVLVFTDAGGSVIETRTEAVEFTGGVGSVTLTDVDGASFRLSAKTAWNLRKRLEVGLDSVGQAVVDFTVTNELPGGDINGDTQNVVNTLDYSVLRFHWFKDVTLLPAAAVADINGDGVINATDYAILQSNFYQAGDPQ